MNLKFAGFGLAALFSLSGLLFVLNQPRMASEVGHQLKDETEVSEAEVNAALSAADDAVPVSQSHPDESAAGSYPADFLVSFMPGCKSSYSKARGQSGERAGEDDADRYCQCVLDETQREIPYGYFVETSMNMAMGKTPENADAQTRIMEIAEECAGGQVEDAM